MIAQKHLTNFIGIPHSSIWRRYGRVGRRGNLLRHRAAESDHGRRLQLHVHEEQQFFEPKPKEQDRGAGGPGRASIHGRAGWQLDRHRIRVSGIDRIAIRGYYFDHYLCSL